MQAALLCTKVYLRFLDTLLSPNEANEVGPQEDQDVDGVALWSQILEMMERLVKSGGAGDGLEEAVPESVKNIVLVMSSSEYIAPPSQQERTELQQRLWKASSERLEKFLPNLLSEVFTNSRNVSPQLAVNADVQKPAENGVIDSQSSTTEERARKEVEGGEDGIS